MHLSEFVWTLRSSVLVFFNNFLLIDATDRSLYPLSFFANTPFKCEVKKRNMFTGTVLINPSAPHFIEWHVLITTVPIRKISHVFYLPPRESNCRRYRMFSNYHPGNLTVEHIACFLTTNIEKESL